ncbi:hypothetical protein ABB37_08398 [Leptomonas pyrrhocoris]|uniref:Uncharacterized protein n=1 Tax=Leptomonas pyrrhocoris TaxID=157538 RepID=A0A0N0VDG4_LEPPY|nr:hypothetical protein ABB37_08398 [Leptomonas pyrrhocoris]KPA75501.1 hypothetical protein ABB37_08398 [Leptomonas pyrrhocoris]|eukprot:XP_015653940.1 hypothetical protein ABB37_08398 [Leptomonas pyrrhocoris]
MVRLGVFTPVCVLAVLLSCFAATTAQADMFLAPTASYVPVAALDDLQRACQAVQADSTVQALYTAAVKTDVNEYMANQSATQAFVAAAYTDKVGWYWHVTQMGETSTFAVLASEFVGGRLPDGTTGRYAVYSTTAGGLQAADGRTDYKVLCYTERRYSEKKKSKFPWWAILIIVLGCVAVVAVVLTVVLCCCCKKKQRYTDDNEDGESALSSRSGSFRTQSTSFAGSSRTGSFSRSSSFSSRGSSFSGASKSSSVTGSTATSSVGSASLSSSAAASSVTSGSRSASASETSSSLSHNSAENELTKT